MVYGEEIKSRSQFKTSTTKLGFQFRKKVKVREGQDRRIWGMGKKLKAAVSYSSHRNLGCVSWRIVEQEQNALSQFAPPFTCDFLTQTSQFVCIKSTVYGTTLLKIVNYHYPLTIPPPQKKKFGWHPLEFLWRR
jgi:hypothetical protein